jgi:hypothetical protein
MNLRSWFYRSTAIGLLLAAQLGGPTFSLAQVGAPPIDLGRFIITQISSEYPAEIRAQFSFQVLISVPQNEWEMARLSVPAYRDIVIRTAYGYVAYLARNGADSSPDRLASLIALRIGEELVIPAPVFMTLPNYQEVRPAVQGGAPRAPR